MNVQKTINAVFRVFRHFYLSTRLAKLGKGAMIESGIKWHNRHGIEIGSHVFVRGGCRLEVLNRLDKGQVKVRFFIGDRTSLQQGCQIVVCEKVEIGNDVLVAANVLITDHDHVFDHPTKPASMVRELRSAPVVIEDGCWLGYGSVVLKGVRIGRRSVIGANAVVTRDIPPYSVAVGNPARVIRTIDVPPQGG